MWALFRPVAAVRVAVDHRPELPCIWFPRCACEHYVNVCRGCLWSYIGRSIRHIPMVCNPGREIIHVLVSLPPHGNSSRESEETVKCPQYFHNLHCPKTM